MRHAIFGALAAVLALSAGSSALAQQSYNNPVPKLSDAGAPHKEVDLIGDILYNSNVADSDAQIAAARGLSLSDVIFTPRIQLDLAHPFGPGQLFLNGAAGYTFYAKNTVLDREHIDLGGGAAGRYFLCDETLSGSVARQQQDLNQQSVLTLSNTVSNESVNLAAECGRQTGLSPQFSISQNWRTNSAQIDSFNNERTFSAVAVLAYRRPTFGSLGVFGDFDQITYENRTIVIGGQTLTSGFDNYSIGLRYLHQFGSRLQTTASLSYTDLQPSIQGGVAYQGFTYKFDASYAAGERLSLSGDFSRATAPSTYVYASFSVNTREEADLAYQLSRRIKLRLLGSILNQNYHGLFLNPAIELTNQTIYDITGTADFALNRRITLGVTLGGQKRDANIPGLSYSNFVAGVQAKAAL